MGKFRQWSRTKDAVAKLREAVLQLEAEHRKLTYVPQYPSQIAIGFAPCKEALSIVNRANHQIKPVWKKLQRFFSMGTNEPSGGRFYFNFKDGLNEAEAIAAAEELKAVLKPLAEKFATHGEEGIHVSPQYTE